MSEPFRRIESPTNARVKAWRALHKRRERDASSLCLVEGARELSRALAAGLRIEAALTVETVSPSGADLAAALQRSGAERFEMSAPAHAKVSQRRHPAEVIGVVEIPERRLSDVNLGETALVLVADAIEKPGNVGAMIRSADGAGADAVIVSDPVMDLGNPNLIRASQGVIFGYPVATGSAAETAAWLEANNVKPIVATDGAPKELWDTDLTGSVAIVIGSEDKGVSDEWRRHTAISIPMRGHSDSLNASVAAAVILYEAARQRRG